MTGKTIPKETIRTIIIIVVGFLIILVGIQIIFGTQNPFYVVASGSMIPVLQVYDVLVVQGHEPFEDIEVGDIIVFDRPSDHNRVIVHRVVSITEEDPRTIRTKGDANSASIPGTDYPITEEEYIGKVEHVIPQVGYFTQLIKPPVNYIIIAVVIGIMIIKWKIKKQRQSKSLLSDLDKPDTAEELSDVDQIQSESAYTDHVEKSEVSGEGVTDEVDDKEVDDKEVDKATQDKATEKEKEKSKNDEG